MMKTVYLCGPIDGCTDAECKDWREYAKIRLPKTLDPMRRDYRSREDDCTAEIVELDKIDVLKSDVLLVNFDKPSVGTSMEVLYAWQYGKTIVTVCVPGQPISPWMKYHSHAICYSFNEAIEYIQSL